MNNQNNDGLIGDGSNNIVNSGNIINSEIVIEINDSEDELDRLLDRLVSKDALRNSFYSPPECHPNTRTTVRNEIGDWIDETESVKSPLLWLNGPVAVGKSVIAKTVSGFHDQIAATFFFSTSSDKSAATLFPTLAWQLARRIPDTRKHIIASLKNSGSLQTNQIEEQFDLLIIQPLRRTVLRSRPVMVIDGVDECTDEAMLVRFLRVLVQAGDAGNIPVRFVICSRPEPRIHAILGTVGDVNPTINRQEPQGPQLHRLVYRSPTFVLRLIRSSILFIVFIAFIATFALLPVLITPIGALSLTLTLSAVSMTLMLLLGSFILLLILHSESEAHLHTPIQRSQGFLQGVWEIYRPIRLGADKDIPFSATCSELADTLDRLCPHPVISTIQIGFSQESKDDISKYLTDSFSAIHQPGEGRGTNPWFQPSDISNLVEASCGQFLYASTIVRLLDESYFDPRDVFNMARRSSLPTPDLNKLYKAILKRAQSTIQKRAQEGGPDYQTEWRFVMDSLAMLVFFAGNDHLCTMQNSLPVIESLLRLEKGKLALKLRKMHSVLRIGAGDTVQAHHRSFLEFLQNQERSGEYYTGYSKALRRMLILMTLTGFRYHTIHFRRRSE